jgi:hypothetical protein
MIHKDSWSWTRRTFMKSSVAGALLAAYKLLWPSVAQAGRLPTTTQCADREVIHNGETDPFGVAGLGESGVRKSRLGFELCPGRSDPSS